MIRKIVNLRALERMGSIQRKLRFIFTLAHQTTTMYRTMKLAFMVFLSLLFVVSKGQESGQIELFDEGGSGWMTGGDANWHFDNGKLIGDAAQGDGFIMTEKPYSEFVLELEFFPDEQVNSGVFLRCEEKELSASKCYEINIWDNHPNQAFRTGAVVSRTEPLQIVQTIDRWNTYKIRFKDGKIRAWINEVLVVDLQDNSITQGFIALQAAEKGKIKFRNVRLQLLNN